MPDPSFLFADLTLPAPVLVVENEPLLLLQPHCVSALVLQEH